LRFQASARAGDLSIKRIPLAASERQGDSVSENAQALIELVRNAHINRRFREQGGHVRPHFEQFFLAADTRFVATQPEQTLSKRPIREALKCVSH
jgi:hypothetical protein